MGASHIEVLIKQHRKVGQDRWSGGGLPVFVFDVFKVHLGCIFIAFSRIFRLVQGNGQPCSGGKPLKNATGPNQI